MQNTNYLILLVTEVKIEGKMAYSQVVLLRTA